MPHAGFLTDAEWHILVLKMDKTNITLTVDKALVHAEEPGLKNEADYDDVDIYIGKETKT